MNIDLTGKVALVTGAAGGIGRAVVAALLEAGASVVAEDLNPAVRELEQLSPRLVSVQGPVADTATAQAAVALAEATFGGLDILINNAGRTFPKALADTTDAEWDGLMADNVKGMFVHAREALPSLRRRGGGAIVNTSSVSGVVGMPNLVAYSASKGAVNQFTKSLALELAPHCIRVNAVAPGVIDTPILDLFGANGRQALQEAGANEPLGRAGQPDEIANVILFLASPQASFMTGTIVLADGGYTAH